MYENLLSRQGLSVDRLHSFLLVADAGGIAAAAPRNPVRQSLLSRQIRELEGFFGLALTERRGRGLVLTEAGLHLARIVRETLQGLSDVAAASHGDLPEFCLGAGDSLLQWWVIPRLTPPGLDGPAYRLKLTALASVDIVAGLLDARLDLGLVRASEVPRGLRSRPLGRVAFALYVPRKLARKDATVAELLSTVPLALQQSEPELNDQLAAAVHMDRPIRPALACETFPQACRAVASGRFAALLPVLARGELGGARAVEFALPSIGAKGGKVHLAWHPRTERTRPHAPPMIAALTAALERADTT